MLSVIFYLSCVGLIASISLVMPAFVALITQDIIIAQRLAVYAVLGVFLFATPVLAIIGRERQIPRTGGLILVLLVWTITPLVIAIPIYDISNLSFVDSFFEAMSGLTTTGSTTIPNINQEPQSLIFFRAQTQWMGGALTLLTIFAVIAPLGIGGVALSNTTNAVMAEEQKVFELFASVIMFYLAATFVAFVMFMMCGIRAFHAAGLAMAAVSTGGFLTFQNEPDTIIGNSGMLIFAVISIIAATSLFWRQMIIRQDWQGVKRHRESWCVIGLVVVLAIMFIAQIVSVTADGKNNIVTTIIEGLFNGAALVSTTGVESRTGMFSLIPLPIILFVVLVGGSTFSSAGGLKQYRIGAMITQSWHELDRLIYPNIVRKPKFGSEFYVTQKMQAVWSCIIVAIATIIIGTVVIATANIPFEAALTATITAFANAGPVYNSTWEQPNWQIIQEFPNTAKITLTIIMLLGRLEVLAVVALCSMDYWRNK